MMPDVCQPSVDRFDVVIVGGGPGGLSAALVLGRARRRVLVCDSGKYRNAASTALHGFITRDGLPPSEFLEIARQQLSPYPVEIRACEVVGGVRSRNGFDLELPHGRRVWGRKLILATGVVDDLPDIEGFSALLGRGVYHCPYCDGWEVRDQPLAVYGRGDERGAGLALELTQWSPHITLCTDGPPELGVDYLKRLRRFGIAVNDQRIERVEPLDGNVRVLFEGLPPMVTHALFFNTGRHQRSDLAEKLGCCEWQAEGCRLDSKVGKTSVPGLYVVGDASRDVLQVVVAAGEGAEAAIAVNRELLVDDGVL